LENISGLNKKRSVSVLKKKKRKKLKKQVVVID
jgi:hypothetical protein